MLWFAGVLLIVTGLVLAIACANVAGGSDRRSHRRHRQSGIRAALRRRPGAARPAYLSADSEGTHSGDGHRGGRDSKYRSITEDRSAAVYDASLQHGAGRSVHVVARSRLPPETMIGAIENELRAVDGSAASKAEPMTSAIAFALLPSRIGAVPVGAASRDSAFRPRAALRRKQLQLKYLTSWAGANLAFQRTSEIMLYF